MLAGYTLSRKGLLPPYPGHMEAERRLTASAAKKKKKKEMGAGENSSLFVAFGLHQLYGGVVFFS